MEEVMQNLLKGYLLAINMKISTFREDAERGIVEFLDNIYHRYSMIPGLSAAQRILNDINDYEGRCLVDLSRGTFRRSQNQHTK